ncbi:flavin reductase family protein [Nonomuraea sp. NPDC049480]|uniref:flavin reductase family protein n=1 Tax=Nonomuraea sp. NPDC049480 TaxID=3364353 RepID=UPI0037A033F5
MENQPENVRLDADVLKRVNRQFVTGVTVVTTCDEGRPRGLAVNAFSSISLDPPLVMICVQRTSSTYESLFSSCHLAINILSADQLDVVSTFATKAPDKFARVDWRPGACGSPLIEGSSAYMEVEIRERLQASTHTIFIGLVVDAGVTAKPSMIYSAGRFYDGAQLTPLTPREPSSAG